MKLCLSQTYLEVRGTYVRRRYLTFNDTEVPGRSIPDTEVLGTLVPDAEVLDRAVPDAEVLSRSFPNTEVLCTSALGWHQNRHSLNPQH